MNVGTRLAEFDRTLINNYLSSNDSLDDFLSLVFPAKVLEQITGERVVNGNDKSPKTNDSVRIEDVVSGILSDSKISKQVSEAVSNLSDSDRINSFIDNLTKDEEVVRVEKSEHKKERNIKLNVALSSCNNVFTAVLIYIGMILIYILDKVGLVTSFLLLPDIFKRVFGLGNMCNKLKMNLTIALIVRGFAWMIMVVIFTMFPVVGIILIVSIFIKCAEVCDEEVFTTMKSKASSSLRKAPQEYTTDTTSTEVVKEDKRQEEVDEDNIMDLTNLLNKRNS